MNNLLLHNSQLNTRIDKRSAKFNSKLTGSTASPHAQNLSAILLSGSGKSVELCKVLSVQDFLLQRSRIKVYIPTAFCESLFDIDDKAGKVPAPRTHNISNKENNDNEQREAMPSYLHLIFMRAFAGNCTRFLSGWANGYLINKVPRPWSKHV